MRWHDTCTIQRATAAVSGYTGRPATTSNAFADVAVVRCSIQPRTSREDHSAGEAVIGAWIGYFPAGTDLRSEDRISWHGLTLTVDGEVAAWWARGAVHHYEAPLKTVS